MDLDQRLFGWLWKRARSFVAPARPPSAACVALEEVEGRLAWVASAIAETPVRIEPADDAGGVGLGVLRLPRRVDGFGDRAAHEAIYLVRAAIDATAVLRRLAPPPEATAAESRVAAIALIGPLRRVLAGALPGIEAAYVAAASPIAAHVAQVAAESPRSMALRAMILCALGDEGEAERGLATELRVIAELEPEAAVRPAFDLAKRVLAAPAGRRDAELALPLAGALLPLPPTVRVGSGDRASPPPSAGGTERQAPARADVKVVELPEDRKTENPLVHSFEKIHTAETYQGGRKALDGMDELAAHEDALRELDLKEVIRTNEAARSVYRMDVASRLDLEDADEPTELGPEHHLYDEWDGHRYLRGHCRLTSEKPRAKPGARRGSNDDPRTKQEVRRVFESLEQMRRARNRMPSGGEVDVDAVVERYAFVRAGHEGSDRLYVDRRRVAFDMATVLLLDLSSSSDAWMNGRRVLDVERPALVALADVLDELRAPFAVGGFFSHTHRDCRYVDLKGFDDEWAAARASVWAVEPQGYTRMGPALRHATTLLARTQVSRRTILLLTDGRPTDYDRYEGRYGVTDVRKACDEASAHGVRVVALAVTERRRPHLAAMFGEGGYEALSDPSELALRLAAIEARLRT